MAETTGGETRAGPPRTIILYYTGSPHALEAARVLEGEGFKVAFWNGESPLACGQDTLLVLPEKARPERAPGKCRVWRIPHVQLLPDLTREALRTGLWDDPWRLTLTIVSRTIREYRGLAGKSIPVRPPPLLVAGEAYYRGSLQPLTRTLERYASEGADRVVIGFPEPPRGRGVVWRAVSRIADRVGVRVWADIWDPNSMVEAVDAGAEAVLSLTPGRLHSIPPEYRGRAWYVLVPCDPGADWEARVSCLLEGVGRAARIGYTRIIVDPVLNPPVRPGALEGLIACKTLSRKMPGIPLMLGANNVYEMIDADTTGTIGLLAALAGEAGASILLAGEESVKAWGSIVEARIAADLAGLALKYGTPPKDYPLRLLVGKEKGR